MSNANVRSTLALLEDRLRRLEFLTTASVPLRPSSKPAVPHVHANETVTARLAQLEDDLQKLRRKSTLVEEVLRLHSRFPELFHPVSDTATDQSLAETSTLASVVLAHASSFPETASRLSSLETLPIPEASASALLMELQPRIDQAMEVQDRQEKEVEELRSRSARLMEWWVNVGVVGLGECWADWEERVRDCGRAVQSVEARNARDAG